MLHFVSSKHLDVDGDSRVFERTSTPESQLTTTTKTAKMEGSTVQAATGARHRSILDLPHFEVRRRICDWVAVMMPNLVVMGDHRQWGPLARAITGFGKFRGRI